MYAIGLVFGPQATMFSFLYKTEEKARAAYDALMVVKDSALIEISDDFSQVGRFNGASIHAFLMENLDETATAQIERGLHNARTQARANTMAQADPSLRAAAALRGNGIMVPGAMPGRA